MQRTDPFLSTNNLHRWAKKFLALATNRYLKSVNRHELIADRFERIYCYHVRKTGGTSLNRAFLSLGGEPHQRVFERLFEGHNYYARSGNLTFVGHNAHLINAGHYFYGFSHHPAHELSLPPRTFTITILRDPAKRVISHYKMLVHLTRNGIDHDCLNREEAWLGQGFDDFISNMPKKDLLRQLYMFSDRFDVAEAVRLIHDCNHVFFTEEFEKGINSLAEKLSLDLPYLHAKKSSVDVTISSEQRKRLRECLSPEYELLDRIESSPDFSPNSFRGH